MNYKTIIIANIAEAFEDVLTRVKSQKERTKKVQIEHNLCDRTLLWEGDNKIIITPFAISPLLFENNTKALGLKNCLNLFPQNVDINLSNAIIKDNPLIKKLVSVIKDNPGIRISPYAVTQSFIDLTEYFNKENLDFIVKERPYKNSDWTVQFLDSKIGSRVEIDKIKDENIDKDKIEEATKFLSDKLQKVGTAIYQKQAKEEKGKEEDGKKNDKDKNRENKDKKNDKDKAEEGEVVEE